MSSPRALAYLAYRALLAHPLKALRRRGTGLERFRAAYVAEGLAPMSQAGRATAFAAQECIACGLCETGCELAGASPQIRALGLHAAFRLYSRNPVERPLAREALAACAGCAGCDALCPTGVPISRIVMALRGDVRGDAGAARGAAA